MVVDLGDGVFINANVGIRIAGVKAAQIVGDLLEHGQGLVLRCHGNIAKRHRRACRDRFQFKAEGFGLAPVVELLVRVQLHRVGLEVLAGVLYLDLGNVRDDDDISLFLLIGQREIHRIGGGNDLVAVLLHQQINAVRQLQESIAAVVGGQRTGQILGHGDPLHLGGSWYRADAGLGGRHGVNVERYIGDGILVLLTSRDLGNAHADIALTPESDGFFRVYPGLAFGNGDQRLILP